MPIQSIIIIEEHIIAMVASWMLCFLMFCDFVAPI